ncbi:MAG: hypothetical protein AAB914_01285, partial [Patescibacteria group bacterium]
SNPAMERIGKSQIDYLAVTDTLPLPKNLPKAPEIEVISVVNLLAQSIKAIFEDGSVSAVFDGENQT